MKHYALLYQKQAVELVAVVVHRLLVAVAVRPLLAVDRHLLVLDCRLKCLAAMSSDLDLHLKLVSHLQVDLLLVDDELAVESVVLKKLKNIFSEFLTLK